MKDILIYAVFNIFTFIYLLVSIFCGVAGLYYLILLNLYSFEHLNKLLIQIFKGDVVYITRYELSDTPFSEWEQVRKK